MRTKRLHGLVFYQMMKMKNLPMKLKLLTKTFLQQAVEVIMIMKQLCKNNSDRSLSYIEINIYLMDVNDNIIYSDWTN